MSHIFQKTFWWSQRPLGKHFVDKQDKSGIFWNLLEGSSKRFIQNFRKQVLPVVKHGAGSGLVWGCFASSGPGWHVVIDRTMNSALYQETLGLRIKQIFLKSGLKSNWHGVIWPYAQKPSTGWFKTEEIWKALYFGCIMFIIPFRMNVLSIFSPSSYLPWFEVFYRLLNNLADYLSKGQVSDEYIILLFSLILTHLCEHHNMNAELSTDQWDEGTPGCAVPAVHTTVSWIHDPADGKALISHKNQYLY